MDIVNLFGMTFVAAGTMLAACAGGGPVGCIAAPALILSGGYMRAEPKPPAPVIQKNTSGDTVIVPGVNLQTPDTQDTNTLKQQRNAYVITDPRYTQSVEVHQRQSFRQYGSC